MLSLFLALSILHFITCDDESKTNEWKSYASDLKLKDHTLISLSDRLFILGGSDENDNPNQRVYHYVTTNHTWMEQDTDNTPSARTKYCVTNVIASSDSSNVQRGFLHGGLAPNGQILGDSYLLTFNIKAEKPFNFTTFTSSGLPPLHSYAMASTPQGDLTMIFGGITTGGEASLKVYIIDWNSTTTNSASFSKATTVFKASDPQPTSEGGTLTFYEFKDGQYIFYYTGGKSQQAGDNLYLWKVAVYLSGSRWETDWDYILYHPSPLPIRVNHHAYNFGPSLFLWGGSSSTSSFSVINVDQKMWYPLDSSTIVIPPLLTRFASCYDSEREVIVVHGGYDVNNSTSLSTNTWEYKLDPCSKNRYCNTCTSDSTNQCLWCSSKARCIGHTSTATAESCTVPVENAARCPTTASCADHTDCSSCAADARCGWCREMSGYPRSTYGCFEGSSNGPYLGTCNGWAATADTCASLDFDINLLLPSEGENIACGDARFLMWTTFGLEDSSTAKYDIFVTYADGRTTPLQAEADGSGYLIWYVPMGKEGKCTITFNYAGQSKTLLTRNVTLFAPKLQIDSPTSGSVIESYSLDITWSDPQELSTVYSSLALQLEYESVSYIIYETGSYLSSYTWNIEAAFLRSSTGKYNITIYWNPRSEDGSTTPVQVAQVTNLSINLPEPAITITSPSTTVDYLVPGQQINIAWDANKKPDSANLYLMEGNTKVSVIETIALNIRSTVANQSWIVDVPYDSQFYFFRVEDAANTTYHGDSGHFIINASKLIVSFSDLPDNDQGHNRTVGDKITVAWDCTPSTSTYRIDIFTASNETYVIAKSIPVGTTKYTFSLPTSLKNDEICYVQVTANDIHPKLTNVLSGRSAPFRVQAIGALATPSIAATAVLSAFGLILIVGGILFYCLVYRRSRLSGFQQI